MALYVLCFFFIMVWVPRRCTPGRKFFPCATRCRFGDSCEVVIYWRGRWSRFGDSCDLVEGEVVAVGRLLGFV